MSIQSGGHAAVYGGAAGTHADSMRPRAGRWLFFGLTVGCLLLILCHSDTAIACMGRALTLCVKTVIPSLFPFMVLSELLVACGGGEVLGRLFERPFKHLLGISGASVCALMMGMVCGFPVGTKTAVSLCRRGLISPQELTRLICFCNIPSSAFLINAVGVSLFGSRRFGLLLYGICILAALLTAWLLHRIAPLDSANVQAQQTPSAVSAMTAFTHAVSSSATAMLCVCAYVVFFTTLVGTLEHMLASFGIGHTGAALLYGVFELSGGVLQASAIPERTSALLITSALCGWSGVSVHLQILSLCDGEHVRARPYLLCKLLQGALCAGLFALSASLLPTDWLAPTQSVATMVFPSHISHGIALLINGAFVCCAIFLVFHAFGRIIRRK